VASKVEVVVLGLLEEGGPAHGYALLERLRDRSMGFWVEVGKASVYQSLRRLEREGFVTGREQDGEVGPDRRVFRITGSGRKRLRDAATELAGDRALSDTTAGAALGVANALPVGGRRRLAEAREQALRDLLDAVGAERDRLASEPESASGTADAMLAREQALAEAELVWLRAFRRSIGNATP
jgi:PadR family transcriptional regulator PadR